MSFASDIKDEVVRVRVKEGAVKLAELSALTFACGNLKLGRKKAVSYRTENREVGKHIAALGSSLYGLEVEMEERVHLLIQPCHLGDSSFSCRRAVFKLE